MNNIYRNSLSRIKAGDWIALAAFLVALFSVGWQVKDAWVGADVHMLDMSNRPVEIRCHSKIKDTCWGSIENPDDSTGRFTVVLPVFFYNDGAVNYNAVVERLTAEVSYSGLSQPVELVANQFWQLVQGGGGKDSRPFVPIVIEGKRGNGAEIRFAPFDDSNFVNWRDLALDISEDRINEFDIQVNAYFVGEQKPRTQSCKFEINERLREKLKSRIQRRSTQVRLTLTCR